MIAQLRETFPYNSIAKRFGIQRKRTNLKSVAELRRRVLGWKLRPDWLDYETCSMSGIRNT
jgi:hypothetical protein